MPKRPPQKDSKPATPGDTEHGFKIPEGTPGGVNDPAPLTAQDQQEIKKANTTKSALDSVAIEDRKIASWFGDVEPNAEQRDAIRRVRLAGAAMAQTIKNNTIGSPDQTAAIRKVREAVDTAIAGIKCGNL